METNELKNIWVEINGVLTPKSKSELKEILLDKTKKVLRKFLILLIVDVTICLGVIVFLVITSVNRWYDMLYLINNSILALIIIATLLYYLVYYVKLYIKRTESFTVNESLEKRIQILTGSTKKKYGFVLVLFIGILMIFSVNAYYSAKSLAEAFQNEENLWGLLFGFIIGIITGFYFYKKIQKYYKKELSILKNYQKELQALS